MSVGVGRVPASRRALKHHEAAPVATTAVRSPTPSDNPLSPSLGVHDGGTPL